MDSENIQAYVDSLDASIANLRESLKPMLRMPLQDSIAECNSPQEQIKVYHAHLYTIISVLFSYLKVLGVKTEDHPIMKDLKKVQSAMKSLKQYEASLTRKEQKEEAAQQATNEYVQRALGNSGGSAATESMKSPAISSANFKGTHTKFEEEPESSNASETTTAKTTPSKAAPSKAAPQKNASQKTKAASKPSKVTKPGRKDTKSKAGNGKRKA